MNRSTVSSADFDNLRSSNFRLSSTVQELRLELSYYQGETKRLENENKKMKRECAKMASLFKQWVSEQKSKLSSPLHSIVGNPEYLATMVLTDFEGCLASVRDIFTRVKHLGPIPLQPHIRRHELEQQNDFADNMRATIFRGGGSRTIHFKLS